MSESGWTGDEGSLLLFCFVSCFTSRLGSRPFPNYSWNVESGQVSDLRLCAIFLVSSMPAFAAAFGRLFCLLAFLVRTPRVDVETETIHFT